MLQQEQNKRFSKLLLHYSLNGLEDEEEDDSEEDESEDETTQMNGENEDTDDAVNGN